MWFTYHCCVVLYFSCRCIIFQLLSYHISVVVASDSSLPGSSRQLNAELEELKSMINTWNNLGVVHLPLYRISVTVASYFSCRCIPFGPKLCEVCHMHFLCICCVLAAYEALFTTVTVVQVCPPPHRALPPAP